MQSVAVLRLAAVGCSERRRCYTSPDLEPIWQSNGLLIRRSGFQSPRAHHELPTTRCATDLGKHRAELCGLWEVAAKRSSQEHADMAKWWDMSIEQLAEEAEAGLRTPDIRPDAVKGIPELLHAKVAIATAESRTSSLGGSSSLPGSSPERQSRSSSRQWRSSLSLWGTSSLVPPAAALPTRRRSTPARCVPASRPTDCLDRVASGARSRARRSQAAGSGEG